MLTALRAFAVGVAFTCLRTTGNQPSPGPHTQQKQHKKTVETPSFLTFRLAGVLSVALADAVTIGFPFLLAILLKVFFVETVHDLHPLP